MHPAQAPWFRHQRPWHGLGDFECFPFGRHRHGHGPGHPPGPPPPPWFFHMFGGPPPRAERGEVRYLILGALEQQPRHGYEIIQTIEERSGGAYRPSPGTIYPTLQMLEELGHVRSVERDARKIYELTDEGRAELEAHRHEVEDAYERFRSRAEWPDWSDFADVHELGHRLHRVVRAVTRAFRRGALDPKRWREIQEVITTAADRIEEILKRD